MSLIDPSFIQPGFEPYSTLAALICAYLLGSISCAVLICRRWGSTDPRLSGSHNPGATNVLRTAGRTAAIATLTGDFCKGALAVLIAIRLNAPPELAALAAVLGHLYPIFFHFRGGKGVATTLGACLALSWPLGLAQITVWLALAALGRISSLAALGCALCSPLLSYWLAPQFLVIVTLLSLIIIVSHRQNIRDLLNHSERRC